MFHHLCLCVFILFFFSFFLDFVLFVIIGVLVVFILFFFLFYSVSACHRNHHLYFPYPFHFHYFPPFLYHHEYSYVSSIRFDSFTSVFFLLIYLCLYLHYHHHHLAFIFSFLSTLSRFFISYLQSFLKYILTPHLFLFIVFYL